jgi:hypothetical protein
MGDGKWSFTKARPLRPLMDEGPVRHDKGKIFLRSGVQFSCATLGRSNTMARNIEIKAYVPDLDTIRAKVAPLASGPGEILEQTDNLLYRSSGASEGSRILGRLG